MINLVPQYRGPRTVAAPPAEDLAKFYDYVLGMYSEVYAATFDYVPPTLAEIIRATAGAIHHYDMVDSTSPLGPQRELKWDGGSHEREVVRDIILLRRGKSRPEDLEHGRVASHIVAVAGG